MIPLISFTPELATIVGAKIRHCHASHIRISKLLTGIHPSGFYYNQYLETLLIHSYVSIGQYNE